MVLKSAIERGMTHSETPCNDMVAHLLEYAHPAIGNIRAGIHLVQIEQADAKSWGEAHEGDAGQKEEGIKSGMHAATGFLWLFYTNIIWYQTYVKIVWTLITICNISYVDSSIRAGHPAEHRQPHPAGGLHGGGYAYL